MDNDLTHNKNHSRFTLAHNFLPRVCILQITTVLHRPQTYGRVHLTNF